jgi:hypothetical protein
VSRSPAQYGQTFSAAWSPTNFVDRSEGHGVLIGCRRDKSTLLFCTLRITFAIRLKIDLLNQSALSPARLFGTFRSTDRFALTKMPRESTMPREPDRRPGGGRDGNSNLHIHAVLGLNGNKVKLSVKAADAMSKAA